MNFGRKRAVVGCFCAAVLAAAGHADLVFASFPRSGDLQVTKECSAYTGAAGDVCTITSSNVKEIEAGVGAEITGEEVESAKLLDVEAHELVLGSGRIGLTSLEFGVMCYLLERPGKAVGRYDLMEAEWGYRNPTASNVVDVVVRSLRRKLGADGACVETVRGTGYRYRVPRQ